MIDVSINPENMEGVYLECLNTCFADWGGMEMYRWCFDRRLGGRKPHIMLLEKGGTILGGSAVTYRHAVINGKIAVIAIMTGSWTLPEARNQGCFATMIDRSLLLARDAGAALLIAFVTQTNPSMKRLVSKGSAVFPTHYLVAGQAEVPPGPWVPLTAVADIGECSLDIPGFLASGRAGHPYFTYSAEEWRSQFVERPEAMEFLCIDGACVGIVEKKGPFDRLLSFRGHQGHSREDILRACYVRSLKNERRLFFFTASSSLKDYAVKLGFEHIPGFLTTLIANKAALRRAFPGSTGGSPASADIYDPGSPWYIGEWDLATGDRM